MSAIEDIFWDAELVRDVGRDRKWIIPDKEELDPPESINSGENDAFELFSLTREVLQTPPTNKSSNHIVVQILEERGRGVWDAVGGEVWEASLLLAIWIRIQLPRYDELKIRSIMEVGCGVALPSIFLSHFLAFSSEGFNFSPDFRNIHVTLTDHDVCLIKNLFTNFTSSTFSYDSPVIAAEAGRCEDAASMTTTNHQCINLSKLDWMLFDSDQNNEDYDALLPPGLNRYAFDLIYGSALCYASCHKRLVYLIRYYLSGKCREFVIVQIADREGFQDLVASFQSMEIQYSLETVPKNVYDLACMVQLRGSSSVGSASANASESTDSIQKFVDYSIPTLLETSVDDDHDCIGRKPVIRTERESFALLRIFR